MSTVINECHVFRLPPETNHGSAGAYRAEKWTPDMLQWRGRLSVAHGAAEAIVRLEDAAPPHALFAECYFTSWRDGSVVGCVDSSRYFVVRLTDRARRQNALVGLGIPDASAALDFKMALGDWERRQQPPPAAPAGRAPAAPLAESQTIRLALRGAAAGRPSAPSGQSDSAQLPPPPSGGPSSWVTF